MSHLRRTPMLLKVCSERTEPMSVQDLFDAFEKAFTKLGADQDAVSKSQAKVASAQADLLSNQGLVKDDAPALNEAADALIAAITAAKVPA